MYATVHFVALCSMMLKGEPVFRCPALEVWNNKTAKRPISTDTLRGVNRISSPAFSRFLDNHTKEEGGIPHEVAPPQPLGLLDEPMQPLEPVIRHPGWCQTLLSCREIYHRAAREYYIHRQLVQHSLNPVLLFRHPESNEQKIGLRLV